MNKNYKSYKFRLLPNIHQQIFINKTLGCCRLIYNLMLNERKENYQIKKDIEIIENMYNSEHKKLEFKLTSEKEWKNKKEYEFMKEIDSQALLQVRRDLEYSYKNYFRKLKLNQKTDLKFKSKKNSKNSYRTIRKSVIRIENNYIRIPKIGWIKFKKSRDVLGKLIHVTIIKTKTNKYFISICCEEDIKQKQLLEKSIGIDLGLKSFATTSDNEFIDNPNFLIKSEKKLKNCQRDLSRKVQRKLDKGEKVEGKNIEKNRLKLAKIYEKINNQKTDFLQKLSTKIINENQIIVLEYLKVSNMIKNKIFAKSISEVSWSSFISMLKYKSDWYGRNLIFVDPKNTSKKCSKCGKIKEELLLSDRVYNCNCGLKIDRDYNASLNILKKGLNLFNLENKKDRSYPVSLINIESLDLSSQEMVK
jgi:putative transposase